MDTFEETLQRMAAMSPDERRAFVEENRQKCICPGWPTYNDCMRGKDERLFCIVGKSGCEIVQQGVCSPADLDRAVELGLGYPNGPLAWGDVLSPARVLAILHTLQARTGDMRYRPSLWLVRRAELGLSLRA